MISIPARVVVLGASALLLSVGGGCAHRNTGSSAGDHPNSRYYRHPDVYAMKSGQGLVVLEHFFTYQQTTEWSCGPAVALMALRYAGLTNFTEAGIAAAMRTHTDSTTPGAPPGSARRFGDYGTSVTQMTEFFERMPDMKVVESSCRPTGKTPPCIADDDPAYPPSERGNWPPTFTSSSLYTAENGNPRAPAVTDAADTYFVMWLTGHLRAGRPILVEWADWGGHWQAIIGYDSCGTPWMKDDVLILADPYDTTDHLQNGYYLYPLERWFYLWSDTRIASKPHQLQPYVVVERAGNQ